MGDDSVALCSDLEKVGTEDIRISVGVTPVRPKRTLQGTLQDRALFLPANREESRIDVLEEDRKYPGVSICSKTIRPSNRIGHLRRHSPAFKSSVLVSSLLKKNVDREFAHPRKEAMPKTFGVSPGRLRDGLNNGKLRKQWAVALLDPRVTRETSVPVGYRQLRYPLAPASEPKP